MNIRKHGAFRRPVLVAERGQSALVQLAPSSERPGSEETRVDAAAIR